MNDRTKAAGDERVLGAMPLLLKPSRKKWIGVALIGLLFTGIGVAMAMGGDKKGYGIAVFFGLVAIIAIVSLLPGAASLLLERDSFTFVSLFRSHTVRWSDVAGFGVISIGVKSMVAWNFAPGAEPDSKLRQANRAVAGYDGAVPDTYGLKVEELATMMEALRQRFWNEHGLSTPSPDDLYEVLPEAGPEFEKAEWVKPS